MLGCYKVNYLFFVLDNVAIYFPTCLIALLVYQIEILEEFEKVSTSEERQSFVEKLDEVITLFLGQQTRNFIDTKFDLGFLHSVRCKIGCIQMVKMPTLPSFKSV